MSSAKQIGKLTEPSSKTVEWTIDNFLSYTETGSCYASPDFCLLNYFFHIEIYPNGKDKESQNSVSLFLDKNDIQFQKNIEFKFGIISTDNEILKIRKATWNFEENQGRGFGFYKFIARSELLKEKEFLLPSGALILSCSVHATGSDIYTRMNKLAADFKNMFYSKKTADVTIKVKEETFTAHRFILAARSPVLAAMFEHEMTEKKTGFLDISDCDPMAFNHFLLYLYSGELDSKKCDLFHLYKIADKYDVSELRLMCIDSIIHNLSLENFCETYVFGHQFNEMDLLTNVQNFFNENFEKIISSDILLCMMKEDCNLANNLLKASKLKIDK